MPFALYLSEMIVPASITARLILARSGYNEKRIVDEFRSETTKQMDTLTIGLAQCYPKFGDVQANLQSHMQLMAQAAEQSVDLIVFPELSLTGYYLRDLVDDVAMTTAGPELQTLCNTSRQYQMDTMVGFVERDRRGHFYIAAAYISRGEVLHIHRKVYLPTYTFFEDARFFAPGNRIRAFETPYGRVGMLICEDFWHVATSYVLWMDGADILLLHSASPGRGISSEDGLETSHRVNRLIQSYSAFYTSYVVHCNRVGFEQGEIFWGGSMIADPNGSIVMQAPQFDEALVVQEVNLSKIQQSRSRTPLLRDERMALTLRELGRIARQQAD